MDAACRWASSDVHECVVSSRSVTCGQSGKQAQRLFAPLLGELIWHPAPSLNPFLIPFFHYPFLLGFVFFLSSLLSFCLFYFPSQLLFLGNSSWTGRLIDILPVSLGKLLPLFLPVCSPHHRYEDVPWCCAGWYWWHCMSMTSVSALGKEWRNSAFIEVINIVKQTIWVSLTKSKVPFFSEPTIGA